MAGSIICGVDESRGAREAARVASDLADQLQARLILVYVPPPLVLEPPPGQVPRMSGREVDAHREQWREQAESVVEAVARAAGVERAAERRVIPGDAADRILEEARKEGAELIVVGSRRQGAVRSALLGSVSTTVTREARCPVVLVPEGVVEHAFAL